MDNLVVRLRAMPSSLNDACRTMEAAADRIETLKAARGVDLQQIAIQLTQSAETMRVARARIEALEAALRDIIAETTWKSVPIKTPQSTEDIYMIARAALDKDAGK